MSPNSGENTTLNIVPTTGPDADLASGENNAKEPSVRSRSLINLTDDDVGWTRSIEGYIHNVEIEDTRVVLELEDGDYNFSVYFEEFFFDNAPVNFRGYFEDLKMLVHKHKDYLFSGVGLIERRKEHYGMLMNRGTDFYVNYQYIAVFLHNPSS